MDTGQGLNMSRQWTRRVLLYEFVGARARLAHAAQIDEGVDGERPTLLRLRRFAEAHLGLVGIGKRRGGSTSNDCAANTVSLGG